MADLLSPDDERPGISPVQPPSDLPSTSSAAAAAASDSAITSSALLSGGTDGGLPVTPPMASDGADSANGGAPVEAAAGAEAVAGAEAAAGAAEAKVEAPAAVRADEGRAPRPALLAALVGLVAVIACVVAVPLLLGRMAPSNPAEAPAVETSAGESAEVAADGDTAPEGDGSLGGVASEGDGQAVAEGAAEGGEEVPTAGPIVSEGAGYAFADDLLAAVTPGLNRALAAPDDPSAQAQWVRSALSFLPADYLSAWSASLGADSPAALIERLADPEVAALAATLAPEGFALVQGEACSPEEVRSLEARFKDVGLERFLQAAYVVNAQPTAAGAAGEGGAAPEAEDSASAAEGAGASDAAASEAPEAFPTAYRIIKINDAWYLAPSIFSL